jgi:hypothetical protein
VSGGGDAVSAGGDAVSAGGDAVSAGGDAVSAGGDAVSGVSALFRAASLARYSRCFCAWYPLCVLRYSLAYCLVYSLRLRSAWISAMVI